MDHVPVSCFNIRLIVRIFVEKRDFWLRYLDLRRFLHGLRICIWKILIVL